jgi:hypothetical protein
LGSLLAADVTIVTSFVPLMEKSGVREASYHFVPVAIAHAVDRGRDDGIVIRILP